MDYLKGIWERNWLTNQGPLVKELEEKLRCYHNLSSPVYCVANGTLGLQIALKALGVRGEIVTTPFSYVATTSCPLWEGCKVNFADIESNTLTIDPEAVEAGITPQTEAILATHVFGNPCDVEALDAIAAKHGLAVVYDAAHAFGVTYGGRSLLEYGDASMVSLHATKLMHSVEGGFVFAKDPRILKKMEWMRRFGHKGPKEFFGVAINAKLSEFHAAMGLCTLNHADLILKKRKAICDIYDQLLLGDREEAAFSVDRISDTRYQLCPIIYRATASRNYAYYPVIFESENKLLSAMRQLEGKGIFTRRYFHPALDLVHELTGKRKPCPISKNISKRILCLPLSSSIDQCEIDRICLEIKNIQGI